MSIGLLWKTLSSQQVFHGETVHPMDGETVHLLGLEDGETVHP